MPSFSAVVMNNSSKTPSFQAVFPYVSLDKRALDFARQTAVRNKEKILAEIDAHTALLEKQHQDELIQKVLGGLRL
ncbi:MAG: hypothetical protein K2O31_05185 [Clostridia bacterium]|nr:hypothetical protein [Clostridia bacterium]